MIKRAIFCCLGLLILMPGCAMSETGGMSGGATPTAATVAQGQPEVPSQGAETSAGQIVPVTATMAQGQPEVPSQGAETSAGQIVPVTATIPTATAATQEQRDVPGAGVEADVGQFIPPTPTLSPAPPRRAPPAGVAAELAIFGSGGGGDYCDGEVSLDRPASVEMNATVEVGQYLLICFDGVILDQPIDITLTWPNRKVEQFQWQLAPTYAAVRWVASPDRPLGQYHVEIRQGERQATDAFTVVPATSPHIVAIPNSGPPGTVFKLVMAGFVPGSTVNAHLYVSGCSSESSGFGCGSYVESLAPITIDDQGSAVYDLDTATDAHEGEYRVIHDAVSIEQQQQGYSALFTIIAP